MSAPSDASAAAAGPAKSKLYQHTLTQMITHQDLQEDWSAIRRNVHAFSKSWEFESFVGFVIVMNAGVAWYETDISAVSGYETPAWLDIFNVAMFGLYALEMSLRLVALQGSFFAGIVNWNTFDLSLVCADGIMMVLRLAYPQMENNSAIRALRICRSFRLVKAVRLWPAFRELYVMMHGLIGAFKAMLWSTVLLFLVLTLFGIVAVEVINPLTKQLAAEGAFQECFRCERAFGSVWASMLTFFQQVVAGDSWGLLTIPIMEQYPLTSPFFIVVLVTIQFGILNLILVAIVDQANKSQTDDALFQARVRKEEFDKARHDLLQMCAEIDSDNSGEISLEELLVGFESMPELANQLRFLELGKDDLRILFLALDQDGSGEVSYEEFVEQLFNMQNQDTGVLLSFLKSYVQDIRRAIVAQGKDLAQLKNLLKESVLSDLNVSGTLSNVMKLPVTSNPDEEKSLSSSIKDPDDLSEEESRKQQLNSGSDRTSPVKLREASKLDMSMPMLESRLSPQGPQDLTVVRDLQLLALDLLSQCIKDDLSSGSRVAMVAQSSTSADQSNASTRESIPFGSQSSQVISTPDRIASVRRALNQTNMLIDARDFALQESQQHLARAWNTSSTRPSIPVSEVSTV
eukprot:TRINITY_DN60738_c0_g1_i1.p1 TRINITY_DN60738_c0_g1~~TRINITY_DN60738_c0_g1_i1.p1  ORF type:complete len:631 (+),score=120.63 TRINITY_DN60738_c0_g1_i1:38-1930(+)